MQKITLIDANAIGYQHHLGTKLQVGDIQTQAIFGVVRALRFMEEAEPDSKSIVLWDGEPKWRTEAQPEYKANRSTNKKMVDQKKEYHKQVPFIKNAIEHLGIDQMRAANCEADDLAGAYSRALSARGHQVALITGDKDWLQLVNERVTWMDPIRNEFCNHKGFESFTGYKTPQQFLDAKALMGDASDNLKGVGGIGKVGAKKLIHQYGSVDDFFRKVQFDPDCVRFMPKAWKDFATKRERLEKFLQNRTLMNLNLDMLPGVKDREITKGKFDRDRFQMLCEDFRFNSILTTFDHWISPFERKYDKANR